jgi:menaquinone-dependent protoporphyrinogen oxidase
MLHKILVTYATNFGSTQEAAETIADTLREAGHVVALLPVTAVKDLTEYRAIILGSAVNYGTWLPDALDFVQVNEDVLKCVPVALFCIHIQNTADDAQSRRKRHAYLDEVRPFLTPIAEGYFAGKFDKRGTKGLLPNWLSRFVPTTDKRNWQKVQAWTMDVSKMLLYQPASL